jgi:TetR/AcrR family transcriptional repressor of nem operon
MVRETSRHKLVEAALDLMLAQGYTATRVDEICEAAGLSKGSFYHFFKTKEDIAIAALHQFHENGINAMKAGDFTRCTDPVQRAEKFIDYVEQIAPKQWKKGCMLATFGTEMAESDSHLRKIVQGIMKEYEKEWSEIFAPLAEGTDVTPQEIAGHYAVVIEGGIVMSRIFGKPLLIRKAIHEFRHYLDGIRR